MAKLIQSVEFFVVGGPVQVSRSCYIERSADQDVIDAVVDARFAYVLAARGSGKSSLMLRTSATLRSDSQLTAVVDISQLGTHGEGADPVRWFYSMAHRIVRELRLKVDLQTWWQDRSALNAEHRFADFFSDIVLANTEEPVTILIDEIEQTRELSFAIDFYTVIRNCYALRVSEPDYARLNFVVFGAAPALQLCPDADASPFIIGEAIELPDFSLESCYRFEPGFELGSEAAYGLIERIYAWTQGQPYLTQKLARAVARRGGQLEDVERLANELFLGPNAVLEEPLLSHISSVTMESGASLRPALQIIRRLNKGASIAADLGSVAQERLRIAGLVSTDSDGRLTLRNRIYKAVFSEKWTRGVMPFNWRGLAAVAGVAILFILVPFWYYNYLPRPYIQTLVTPMVDYDSASKAYGRLHRLPGFASQADDLFSEVLAARSREMQTIEDVLATDKEIRSLSDRDAFADSLLADYWIRRANSAIDQEDRDAALVYTVQALLDDRQATLQQINELVGADYRRLEATLHLPEAPLHWQADWQAAAVSVVGASNSGRTRSFAMPAPIPLVSDNVEGFGFQGVTTSSQDTPLTALEHVPLIRELSVDSEGSAGRFELGLVVDHSRAGDLTATLAAPSGAAVTLVLDDEHRTDNGFTLDAATLSALADERRQGVWRLTLVDGQAGVPGVLHRWSLDFADAMEVWLGAPGGIAIPAPERTAEVSVNVSKDGRYAATRPAIEGISGSLAIWDLRSGELLRDIRLQRQPERLFFTADSQQLIVVSDSELSVWSVQTGELTARVRTQTGFVLPPAVSVEGGYLAIAEQVEGTAPLFSLIRIADGELVASVIGQSGVLDWSLGPEARYLILKDGERHLSVMDPRRGGVNSSIELVRPVEKIIALASRDALITVEDTGEVRAWELLVTEDGLDVEADLLVGTTIDADSLSVSDDGDVLAFAVRADSVIVHDLDRRREPLLIRAGRAGNSMRTQLSPDGLSMLTVSGEMIRVWALDDRELMQVPPLDLSALSIDRQGRFAALGFRGGFVRAVSLVAPDVDVAANENVDFIGHRGPITTIALNTEQNLIATGGRDATARLWNLATLSPSDAVLDHEGGFVSNLSLSRDGRWLLSAAEDTAYLWDVTDGSLFNKYQVSGSVTTLNISSDGQLFAIGDNSGNIFVAEPGKDELRTTLRADGAVSALAFGRTLDYVVSGDVFGNLLFWPLDEEVPQIPALQFQQAVRWLEFAENNDALFVQTEQWLHQIDLTDTAQVVRSSLLPAGLESGAAADDDGYWRLLGSLDLGQILVTDIEPVGEMSVADIDDAEPASEIIDVVEPNLRRDWKVILGMRLDAQGNAVPVIR